MIYLNNFLLQIIRTMKMATHVHFSSFEVSRRNSDQSQSSGIFSTHTLCKLRVKSEAARNNCLFNYTLYYLCVKQRSESIHIVCLLTCMIHGCSCSIQVEYYSMTGLAANVIIYVALESCSNRIECSQVSITTQ